MDWQLDRGFSDVEESALVECHSAAGLDFEKLLGGRDFLIGLLLTLIMHYRPGISQLEANIALARGEALRQPATLNTDELPVDESLIYDLVHPTEARTIRDYQKKSAAFRKDHVGESALRREMVKSKIKLAWPKHKAKPPKVLDVKVWKAAETATHVEALTYIRAHVPSVEYLKIATDVSNGRFRLASGLTEWHKSTSWTRRGFSGCASEVIFQAWTHVHGVTGIAPPGNLATLPPLFAA